MKNKKNDEEIEKYVGRSRKEISMQLNVSRRRRTRKNEKKKKLKKSITIIIK